MFGRLVVIAALGVAVALGGAGCADTVSPAARVGDVTVTHDDLMAEVEAWAGSPTMLQQLQVASAGDETGTRFSQEFVGFVLTNRVSFELHNAEFEARDLELNEQTLEEVRQGLFSDPSVTAVVLDELGAPFAEQLVEDVARQFEIQTVLAEEYDAWAEEAFGQTDIEVSPRYGTWDELSGAVLAPKAPTGPGGSLFVEL